MDGVLFDDPDTTIQRLEALRDSPDSQDKATFWRVATSVMPRPLQVEAADDVLVTLNFAGGRDGSDEGFKEIVGSELHSIEGGRARDDGPDH
jgi:hypothetical protein